MLGLRQKIALGFSGLLLIILVIGIQGIVHLTTLGGSIDVILRENYHSVLAAQRMKEALERIDSGLLFILLGESGQGRELVTANVEVFERNLQAELGNITLPGEQEKAILIQTLFAEYKNHIPDVENPAAPASRRRETYFKGLLPLFKRIKSVEDDILGMNQQNMTEANDRARRTASRARRQMYLLLLAGTTLATGSIVLTRRWILRPIHRLIGYAEEIRRGHLDLVVPGGSPDEIGRLSEAFNAMAASLREFRRSDQARLIRIQHATQRAFDSLPDAVAVIDPEGNVEVATEAAKTTFGLRPGEEVSASPFGWMESIVGEALRTGRRATLKNASPVQQFIAGEEKYFRPEAVPILDSDRLSSGVVLVLQDVTQLRQQAEIKQGVIRTVSHQLKTPLTSIRMAIHLLVEEKIGLLNEKQAELLMTAREDSDRLNDILVNLLDISRMEAGKAPLALRSLSPRALIVEAAEPFLRMARDQGVSLGLEIGDDLPFVLADPARIGHVFGNLLTNALQHTKPGGSVKLTAQAEDTVVRFIVADTGSGIPAVALPRIFEPFFRVQGGTRQGAGLGLAIAKEIVEAHGGTIEAESREGRGSSFSFTLRRADIIRGQEHLA